MVFRVVSMLGNGVLMGCSVFSKIRIDIVDDSIKAIAWASR